jgi:hypothetical protein
MDTLLMTLDNKLNEVSNIALTSSIMFSKNPYVINCLSKNDRKLCFDYLIDMKNDMTEYRIFKNMSIHLHTKEYKSFMRLWAYENQTKDSLADIRRSLKKQKALKNHARH